jgi:hypothetical protein
MGNLFYEKVAPSEIKSMSYSELKYWNGWHEKIQEEHERQANKIGNK